eukprot:4910743-Amphidinium_carterae.1
MSAGESATAEATAETPAGAPTEREQAETASSAATATPAPGEQPGASAETSPPAQSEPRQWSSWEHQQWRAWQSQPWWGGHNWGTNAEGWTWTQQQPVPERVAVPVTSWNPPFQAGAVSATFYPSAARQTTEQPPQTTPTTVQPVLPQVIHATSAPARETADPPSWPGWTHYREWKRAIRRWDVTTDILENRRGARVMRMFD